MAAILIPTIGENKMFLKIVKLLGKTIESLTIIIPLVIGLRNIWKNK